jgi:hypothetical protein
MSNLGLERYLETRPDAGAHLRRRPLCARAHARAWLQSRRRAIRPHHPVRLQHHRRRARRRLAGARGGEAEGKPVSEVCHRFEALPQILKNVRYKQGKPLDDAKVKRDRRRDRAARQRPAGDPPLRHRAGDPGDGRGRRPVSGRRGGRRDRRGADPGGGLIFRHSGARPLVASPEPEPKRPAFDPPGFRVPRARCPGMTALLQFRLRTISPFSLCRMA